MLRAIKKGAIALAILLGISLFLRAQTETSVQTGAMPQTIAALLADAGSVSLLAPDAIPQRGTFYSAQNRPPLPYDWNIDLPVYSLGNVIFVIDDTPVNYSAPGAWGATSLQGGDEGARSMGDPGLPSLPGDGGDGTNSGGGGVFWSDDFLSTNGLWLQITGITNDTVSLNLNNATNFVYEIFRTEALSGELTN